jgi:DNA-binding MarR family transcriptional regulator
LARDIPQDGGGSGQDLAFVEAELTRVWARWERAIGQLGGTVPASQLRALLIMDDAGPLPPGQLAVALGISPSGAGRLSDRMAAGGLLRELAAAGSAPGITLVITEAGQKLAGWIREQRRAVLAHGLESMSADGRQALARGLRELAGHQVRPPRDATPPGTHT